MLGKLLKYEFKATSRILLPLYGALLIFAFIVKIFIGTKLDGVNMDFLGGIPAVVSIFTYGATMAAVFIVTIFIIIQRFYKNLLGDEGYLMNTLPVSTTSNISSKLISAIIWSLVSIFVAILSIIIMMYNREAFGNFFSIIPEAFSKAYSEFGGLLILVGIEFLVAGLLQLALNITLIYTSISIGHLLPKMKILGSFGAFIVLNIIMNTIFSSIMLLIPNSFSEYMSLVFQSNMTALVHLIGLGAAFINALWFTIFFLITRYILKNKLNLE
ncbi:MULTISPECIES: ABC transporter permease [Clostridium]|uniref:ABC transporter permease n=1 Tax=Clostridium carnis TaxID=1530 RepID=A0ABY6SSF5_9CLOT|nr:ABC transporter permease [Clostridium carnis]CAI3621631.1 putative ABC transporter, permease component [Clostridium neonatale]CAI3652203.1 putative ABC transporter, permease component [Clostridium neonatale]CAI3667391.1 putative ABC transporter, permease component [Clostridium neonatale]CAI3678405.1 putative ABC transporter, permease component [Clostridium neonatale]CAI3690991.1 putative ABC transporter, permease component [Clostridium neonatale]